MTMVSFTFFTFGFHAAVIDNGSFVSADKKADGRNLLVTKSAQRVEFEEIPPSSGDDRLQLWKYGDRYGCFIS